MDTPLSSPAAVAGAGATPDFRVLFESAPGLHLALRPDFTIIAVSDAYLSATMTRREDILGRCLFDVFPRNPADPEAAGPRRVQASFERVRDTGRADNLPVLQYDIPRPESAGGGFEERYWSLVTSPVLTPGTDEVACIIHRVEDVTEFVRLRQQGIEQSRRTEELEARTQQMEAEIFQRAQQLQEANGQLSAANRRLDQLDQLRTQFFANVSHELRTPLTLIIGLTDKLLRAPGRGAEDIRDLRSVARNGRTLLLHVNDLLDISKLAAGEMRAEYAAVDLTSLVHSVADQFDVIAQDKAIAYSCSAPPDVMAEVDPHKIQRVLMNLLSNAFKFTPREGAIRCTLRLAGADAVLEVGDSGPGVPAEQREAVFERFRQLDGSDTRYSAGTGLGLAIARDFVELHGGSIQIGSAPEGGALFTAQLPLKAPAGMAWRSRPWRVLAYAAEQLHQLQDGGPPAAAGASPAASPGAERPLVLVVEDNPEMNRFLCESLAGHFRTMSAADGDEGLRRAREARPDLILTDLMMPGLGGEALVHAVREDPEMDLTPIVLLTAQADDKLRVQLLEHGAQDYLTKPVPVAELLARVRNLTETKRAREQVLQAEKRVRALMDSAPDAMVVADAQGVIVLVNARTESLFGYGRHELVGRPIETLIPERFQGAHHAQRNGYLKSPVVRPMGANLELFARRRDGSEIPVEVSLSPVATATGLQVVSAIRDVSDRRRALGELRAARQEAEAANRAKSSFLATASHDLRQPLQSLALLNGVLKRVVMDRAAAEAVAEQEAAITVMSRLLNALLDISKLESGAVRPVLTDWQVGPIFDQLRGEYSALAASKGLQLTFAVAPAGVHSDASLVGQVLRNLLSNAIKYTEHGGVRVCCEARGDKVRIEVADTGIGMAREHLEHIYEEFYQIGVPANAARGGYGLGLSIVSRIVKLLDLTIDVTSEVGKGTKFTVELPAAAAAPAADRHRAPLEPVGDPVVAHHILAVDDDRAVLDATRLLLKAAGYRVTTASSISEAVEHASEASGVELLLTDYHLGGGETGEQVIAAVRGASGRELPAILITGDTSSAARGLDPDRGIGFLSKPVEAGELLALVKEFLGRPVSARGGRL